MGDIAKEFEAAVTKRMEQDSFMLFKRVFGMARDDLTLTYCKLNAGKHCNVAVSGLELLRAADVAALGRDKAETAIKHYKVGSK